jgi:hypothetical protein
MHSAKRREITDVQSSAKIIGVADEHVHHSAGKKVIQSTGAIKSGV